MHGEYFLSIESLNSLLNFKKRIKMEYFAHSENDLNEKHRLSDHLLRTAELAQSFTSIDNYKEIFRLAGLLHDLGKYQPAFQNYLKKGGRRGSVPHASWGAGYARICKLIEASIAIDGHHKGLPNNSSWKSSTEPFKRGEITEFENILNSFFAIQESAEMKSQNRIHSRMLIYYNANYL